MGKTYRGDRKHNKVRNNKRDRKRKQKRRTPEQKEVW